MLGSSDVSPSRRSFLSAFKPRQVILLEHRLKNPSLTTPMARNDAEKQGQLNQDEQDVLICSIAMWLETKGFSKVLKRFLSCAQIQDDSWKTKAVNLNEVFSQYLETCRKVHEDSGPGVKKQEEKLTGATEENGNCLASEEIESKKKKKKKTKGQAAVIDSAEALDGTIKSNEKAQDDENCKGSDALGDDDKKSKAPKGPDDGIDVDLNLDQSAKKQKDKKKKKGKLTSDLLDSDVRQIDGVPEVAELKQKDSLAEAAVTGVNESKKPSKKRKKKDAEEKENQFSEEVVLEESKPKKSRHQEESKDALSPEGNALAGSNDEGTNVALNNNEVDKSDSKSAKKQHKNSAEPKSVNAFQRVKIDEVKFADEKLQDNSYWAKDGAEIGYGAKAQEVLGQVKGRDFRHEKTKKKRGSYRGGQIDLQSHSVKFNYSDEE